MQLITSKRTWQNCCPTERQRCNDRPPYDGGVTPHDQDIPAALASVLRMIDEDHVFALIHLIVEQRVKAY
ncbi:hypothetical protein AR539_09010 [Arthrobacter sp. EPSL27]|nr:hypothetical protein AR539_09010 [Arthrobacter sp. EPSL27]